MDNKTLNSAKNARRDEYYTRLADVAEECSHYSALFKGKTVLCNCDDPYESAFCQYFSLNFRELGLKKLICTTYLGSPVAGTVVPLPEGKACKLEITGIVDADGDGVVKPSDVEWTLRNVDGIITPLKEDGDFRSLECLDLMDESDIIVTNPPFSLLREYVTLLAQHRKDFLIIGNKNAITYESIFPMISENRLWLGYRNINSDMWFYVPDEYGFEKIIDNRKVKHTMACWFTNMYTSKRHRDLILYKLYTSKDYPSYDNYFAINVDKVNAIPLDYEGAMGVPVTFLDKYCPEQFEILGCTESEGKGFSNGLWDRTGNVPQPLIKGKRVYKRIFIRNRHPLDLDTLTADDIQWMQDYSSKKTHVPRMLLLEMEEKNTRQDKSEIGGVEKGENYED